MTAMEPEAFADIGSAPGLFHFAAAPEKMVGDTPIFRIRVTVRTG